MMKTASKKKAKNKTSTIDPILQQRLREGGVILTLAISLFMFIALGTYDGADPGWSHTGEGMIIVNSGGRVGAWFADVFLYLFGYFAYLFPVMVVYSAWLLFQGRRDQGPPDYRLITLRSVGFVMLLVAACALADLHFLPNEAHLPFKAGGIVGDILEPWILHTFNPLGATLLLLAVLLTGVTLFTGLSWVRLCDGTGRFSWWLAASTWTGYRYLLEKIQDWRELRAERRAEKAKVKEQARRFNKPEPVIEKPTKQLPEPKTEIRIEPTVSSIKPSKRAQEDRQASLFSSPPEGSLPPLTLLEASKQDNHEHLMSEASLEATSRDVEERLQEFGVQARVVAVLPGPVITRYELELAPGVKVSKLTGLAKDLARSLSEVSVRIVEVIPGKAVVGLEIPNKDRQTVKLREILSSVEFERSRSPLSLALGKDISGKAVVVDLAKMPHLLVAGTTGSGKSVGLNVMLLSLLFKASPADVRMILIDPKMLELAVYEGIPHLLTPVVTDMKDASNALRWCVAEMERRYKLMAALGVRNLAGFNTKIKDAAKKGEPILDPFWHPTGLEGETQPELETLPSIVVIADEFADMMMVVGKKVEELIARIAQKARAAGIHLILATQRPSVDVITGLIKANIPTRIAFQVSQRVDSRTILDQQGAEQLLGQGDMLYLPPGTSVPVRVHGAFVSDAEVHAVVDDLRKRGEPTYLDEITDPSDGALESAPIPGIDAPADEGDELYDQAVQIVTESRRASISHLQRRLKIGYNRAANLIETMETAGVVSQMEGNGQREVLAPPPVES